jgi:hypothetical protein
MGEEDKKKAVGQFRLQLNAVFEPFMCYGQQDLIPEVIGEIVKLSLQLHERLSGKDVPIQTQYKRERLTA